MSYVHFTLVDRGKLEGYLQDGLNANQIAVKLNKHHTSIRREIQRNSCGAEYNATESHECATLRRSNASSNTKLTEEYT